MITPSHIIYSWALARYTKKVASPSESKEKTLHLRTSAFVLGALLPDIPVYIFFVVCGLIWGLPHQILWDDMYFNSWWSLPITLAHSFIFWPIIIGTSSYIGWKFIKWMSISALFHSVIDFFVHTEDAYRHWYPLSDWKFHSPISYWNSAEYGHLVSMFDSLLVLGLLTYLYTKYVGRWRIVIISIGILYIIRLVAEPFISMTHGS